MIDLNSRKTVRTDNVTSIAEAFFWNLLQVLRGVQVTMRPTRNEA
jgi:hypothetical protein